MTYLASHPCGPSGNVDTPCDTLQWRSRYDGLVAIAHIGDKAVAGISGPWSGQFALTWWERPLPARQLELYGSLDAAKREVEDWAQRMRGGAFPIAAADAASAGDQRGTQSRGQPELRAGLINRMRTLVPRFASCEARREASETIERLRREHVCNEPDISDLHFAATE